MGLPFVVEHQSIKIKYLLHFVQPTYQSFTKLLPSEYLFTSTTKLRFNLDILFKFLLCTIEPCSMTEGSVTCNYAFTFSIFFELSTYSRPVQYDGLWQHPGCLSQLSCTLQELFQYFVTHFIFLNRYSVSLQAKSAAILFQFFIFILICSTQCSELFKLIQPCLI